MIAKCNRIGYLSLYQSLKELLTECYENYSIELKDGFLPTFCINS